MMTLCLAVIFFVLNAESSEGHFFSAELPAWRLELNLGKY